jgi:homoserine dehydrogenase
VRFRFESAVMDGAPVFNLWRHTMPGVRVLGFVGALNSTSKVVVETMERGGSFEDGLAAARAMGITEAGGAFDVEGWDSAAKTAALANVLLDARTTPQQVSTRGIARLTPERLAAINAPGQDGAVDQPRAAQLARASPRAYAPKCWTAPTFWRRRRAPPTFCCSTPT